MYYLLGICLAFAALLAINALVSMMAAILWRAAQRPARRWSSTARANLLFALRTVPPVGSLILVVTLLVPAYVAHEPQHSTETVSANLAFLALLSILGIALALWRGLSTWRATRRLNADWMHHAEPVHLDNIFIPAYRLKHSFPVIAIVGFLRPRLFIAAHLFDTLDAEELEAVLLHEKAHLAAGDNFKRPLVRACSDVLAIVPYGGRALNRVWTEESEAAADEYAARVGGGTFALSLASALIKIARQVPEGAKPTMPAGAFLLGEAGAPVAVRIQRLTQLAGNATPHHRATASFAGLTTCFLLCCFFASLCILVTQTHALKTIHDAIEHFVAALQ